MGIETKRQKRRGIDYLVNVKGDKKAVVIDLKIHKELWEDFYDTLLVRERKNEPVESLEVVKKKIKRTR